MSKKRLRIVIVDDEPRYRKLLVAKLTNRLLSCIALPPPETPIADAIVRERPDAVLVDYQLTQSEGTQRRPASYLGSALVAAIRAELPATPIILLTRRTLASRREEFWDHASDLDEAFDDLVFKEDVQTAPAKLRTELASLVDGYRTLTRADGSWNDVVEALRTPEYAKDELRRFGAPVGTVPTDSFRPGSVARWIRRSVLRFPGIVVDDLHAATDLGITLRSFRKPRVLTWFESARYHGVFAAEERRWWRGALRARADSLKPRTTVAESDAEALRFFRVWNHRHPSNRVQVSKCCVCGQPTSESVCEVLKEPVMFRCSVPYYPDGRSAGFDVARISFRAIRETELNDESFASNVLPIVREIEAGNEH